MNKTRFLPLMLTFFSCAALAATMPTFQELDVNTDGVLSQQEVERIQELDFTTADKNGDGFLTLEEYSLVMEENATSEPEVGQLDTKLLQRHVMEQ